MRVTDDDDDDDDDESHDNKLDSEIKVVGHRRNLLQATVVLSKRNRKWVALVSCLVIIAMMMTIIIAVLVRKRSATDDTGYESLFPPQRMHPHPYPAEDLPSESLSPWLCSGVYLGGCCNISCMYESLSVLLECETEQKNARLQWILENSYNKTTKSADVDSIAKVSAEYGIGACEVNETEVALAKNQDRRMMMLKTSAQPTA